MASFPGLHKAAIFLASLPQQQATELLSRLERQQARALETEMSKLADIEPAQRKAIFREFAAAIDPAVQPHHWSVSPPFSFLRHFDRRALVALLKDEHPQTIALIVSYLPRSRAVEFIAALPADQQAELIHRIATMGTINRQIVSEVEIGLQSRLIEALCPPTKTIRSAAA